MVKSITTNSKHSNEYINGTDNAFALCNAPATFEGIMDLVLKCLTWKTCLGYWTKIMMMGKLSRIIYRNFVKDFGKTANPLHRLSENNVQFNWSLDCQKAFNDLKKKLNTVLIKTYPPERGTFISDCDASTHGLR